MLDNGSIVVRNRRFIREQKNVKFAGEVPSTSVEVDSNYSSDYSNDRCITIQQEQNEISDKPEYQETLNIPNQLNDVGMENTEQVIKSVRENVNLSCNAHKNPSNQAISSKTTRRGRISINPARYNDYVSDY